MKFASLATAVVLFAAAAPSSAAITIFTDRTDFLATAGQLDFDDFDDLNEDQSFQNAPLTRGNITFAGTGAAENRRNFINVTTADTSPRTVNGSNFVDLFASPTTAATITFNNAVFEFGFDFADLNEQAEIEFVLDGSRVVAIPSFGASEVGFFGFRDTTAFRTLDIRFRNQGGTEGFGIDEVLSTAAVPEPATWAMMIGGFGLVGGAMRRRRAVIATA